MNWYLNPITKDKVHFSCLFRIVYITFPTTTDTF